MLRFIASWFAIFLLATTAFAQRSGDSRSGNAPPVGSSAADTVRIDVTSAVLRALDVSPEVGAAEAMVDYARARHSLARSSRFLTEFEANSSHSTYPGIDNPNGTPVDRLYLDPDVRNDWEDVAPFNRIEFEAIQPIWTWGQLSGSIRAARAGVDVEQASVRERQEATVVRTAGMVYSILLAESLSRLTGEAGDIVEQAKREINRLLEEGAADVDEADLSQVKITEQEYLQRVVEVEQRLLLARSALRRQLFLPDETELSMGTSILEPLDYSLRSLQDYQATALERRWELDQAGAGISAREALVDVARSDYFPKLFIGANARYSFAADRHRQRNPYVSDPFLSRSLQAGFGIRLKLNFVQTRSRVEQAQAELAEVEMQADGARQLILFEVEEAYRNVIIAREAMDARAAALRESDVWLREEQVNFEYDLGDTENLVDAVKQNLTLQAEEHEAVFNFNMAVIRLLRATGTAAEVLSSGTLVE